jgi:hypothetical protein
LIAITRREQVAQIFGKPIYVVTDVALVPLSSQSEAEKGIAAAARQRETTADTDEDSSDAESAAGESDDVHSAAEVDAPSPSDDMRTKPERDDTTATTKIAEDVFARRGPYGRFASQWLTKKGWGLPGMRAPSKVAETASEQSKTAHATSVQQLSATSVKEETSLPPTDDSRPEQARVSGSPGQDNGGSFPREKDIAIPLLPKLLRSTRLILSSRSFYFSYDFNITRRMGDPRMLDPKPLVHDDIDPLVCVLE